MTTADGSTARSARMAAGTALMLASLVALALGWGGGWASAQEEGVTFQTVTPTATAYYTHAAGEAAPGVLVDEFPPAVVCLLVPEACGADARQVTEPLAGAVPPPDAVPEAPVQPVPPGTLPVATLAGATRYESAIAFELPAIPTDHQVDRFVLRLVETDPTFSLDSPAFRQAVLAAFVSFEQQEPAQEQFEKVLEANPADDQFLGVEACPIIEPFQPGENQPATAVPATDCILGANGTRTEDGAWEFDLTLAADAWHQGNIPAEGVLLRPISAPNLAFGDPDLSTNEQVTFAASADDPPAVAAASSERPEPITFAPGPGTSDRTGSVAPDRGGPVAVARPPVTDRSGRRAGEQPAPDVAAPADGAPSGGPATGPSAEQPQPRNLWWYWLSVPGLLGGMFVTGRALTAPGDAVAPRGGGALTRLVQQRDGGTGGGRPW